MAITSRVRPTLDFAEHVIANWQDAGLLKPSLVEPVLATIEQALVRRVLGRLSSGDSSGLTAIIEAMLKLTADGQ